MRFYTGGAQCWGKSPDQAKCGTCCREGENDQESIDVVPAMSIVASAPAESDPVKQRTSAIAAQYVPIEDPLGEPKPMANNTVASAAGEPPPAADQVPQEGNLAPPSAQEASLDAILAEAKAVSNRVVDALGTPSFRTQPPEESRVYDNAMWLRERVAASDALDPHTPLTVVHWSVLKDLHRMPRNPDDGMHLRKAIDVIDEYTSGSSTRLLVISMISHRWRRPDYPHPDDEKHHKAKALAKYGEAALARNVEMYYWLDFAGVNQENLREKIVGISKLPCIVASCTEFLVFWSDDYEPRAWTRMERFIGYVLSPCPQFRVIDEHYGKPVQLESLTKSGVVTHGSVLHHAPQLQITDPLEGHLTAEADRQQLTRLVEVGRMFPPMAYRGTASHVVDFNKSRVELMRMAAAVAGSKQAMAAKQTTRDFGNDFAMDIVEAAEDEEEAGFKAAAEDVFTRQMREELVMGAGFTLKWFILYNLLRAFLPLFFNSFWIAGAGIAHCGAQQSFFTYMFEFESYFMAVKGCMISAYYWLFMPPPTPERADYTLILHILFGCMFVIFAGGMSTLWKMLELTDKGIVSWLLFKLNFPVGAILSFAAFAPMYLRFNFEADKRYFAAKRYLLLTVVLICDVLLISVSHAYVFFFTWAMEEIIPKYEDNIVVSMSLQALLVSGYTMGIMPVFGKIFWVGVYLVDKMAPMPDLQHQRFIYFATVICDMHRLMYSRELFVGLDSLALFYLILLKDFNYMIYQFGVKAHPVWQTLVIGVFHPDGMADTGRYGKGLVRAMRLVKCIGELMECPKMWLSWHRATIDAGYKGSTEAPSSDMTFFCCDTLINIFNLPSAFSGKFAKLKDLPERERREMIKEWVEENNYHVKNPATLKVDAQTQEQIVERGQDCAIEVKLAEAAADYNDETASNHSRSTATSSWTWTKHMHSNRSAQLGLTWEHEFYRYLNLRLNGLIFLRAQARTTISIAVALSYIFTGLVIRATPSKEVLNFVKDHKESIESKTVIVGVSFLLSDLLIMVLLDWFHLRQRKHRLFHLAKFGRIFQSRVLYAMLSICTVCCSSDFFLTYPDIDFCND